MLVEHRKTSQKAIKSSIFRYSIHLLAREDNFGGQLPAITGIKFYRRQRQVVDATDDPVAPTTLCTIDGVVTTFEPRLAGFVLGELADADADRDSTVLKELGF